METGSGENKIIPCDGSPFQGLFNLSNSAGMRRKKDPQGFFDL
jgi:hypothetical protein